MKKYGNTDKRTDRVIPVIPQNFVCRGYCRRVFGKAKQTKGI